MTRDRGGVHGVQVQRGVPVPSLQARAPSGCDASCRGQEGGLGQRQNEGKKGRLLLLPELLEPTPRSCISRALDGTLKLYKEPGARSINATSQPSPAPPAGEAPGEAGRREESWRPRGHFLGPPVWGPPRPAVPLGHRGSQRPTKPLLSNPGIASVVLTVGSQALFPERGRSDQKS